jgi:SpoVK/Ycf46/Vps4 family AAA+-type ATPase
MFELNVGETPNNLTHKDFKALGEMTEGYSGSDIAIAVRDALMEPIRKLRMATHFKQVIPLSNKRLMIGHGEWTEEVDALLTWRPRRNGNELGRYRGR